MKFIRGKKVQIFPINDHPYKETRGEDYKEDARRAKACFRDAEQDGGEPRRSSILPA